MSVNIACLQSKLNLYLYRLLHSTHDIYSEAWTLNRLEGEGAFVAPYLLFFCLKALIFVKAFKKSKTVHNIVLNIYFGCLS